MWNLLFNWLLLANEERHLRLQLYDEICDDLVDTHICNIRGDFSAAIAGIKRDLDESIYQGLLRSAKILNVGYRDAAHFAIDLELDGHVLRRSPRIMNRLVDRQTGEEQLIPSAVQSLIPAELRRIAEGLMSKYLRRLHYPPPVVLDGREVHPDSPELERARREVPQEMQRLIRLGTLKSGEVLFIGFSESDEKGYFSRFLFRVRLNGLLIELCPKCRLEKDAQGQWGYTLV